VQSYFKHYKNEEEQSKKSSQIQLEAFLPKTQDVASKPKKTKKDFQKFLIKQGLP